MIDLRLGNCLEVMKTIESGSVDAIITDPPYGTTACKWDSVIDFKLMWEQLDRIIKPNGAIVLFGAEPFSSALRISNIKNYKYDWKWIKNIPSNFLNAKKQPLRAYEDVLIFYKKQPTYNPVLTAKPKDNIRRNTIDCVQNNNGVVGNLPNKIKRNGTRTIPLDKNYPLNVLNINTLSKNKRTHPTQKPIALMEYLIKTYTNENETVLDFTMGSGTTMLACRNLKRNGIGIEQDQACFKIAKQRLNESATTLF
jgi:DNA modification methylase